MACGVGPELEKLSSKFTDLKDKANAAISDPSMGITAALDKISGDIATGLTELKAAADGLVPDVAVKLPNLAQELGKLQGALNSGDVLGAANLSAPGGLLSKFSSLSLPGIDVGSLMSGAGGLNLCSQAPNLYLKIEYDEDGNEILTPIMKGLNSDAPVTDADKPEPKITPFSPSQILPALKSPDVPTSMDTETNASASPAPIEEPPSPPSDTVSVSSPFFKGRTTWFAVTSPSVGGGKTTFWMLKAFNGKLSQAYYSWKSNVERTVENLTSDIDFEYSDEPYRVLLDEDEGKYEYHYGKIVHQVRRDDLMSIKAPHPEQASKRAFSAFSKNPFALLNAKSRNTFAPTEKETAGVFASSDFAKPNRNTNWNPVFNDNGLFVGLDYDEKKADAPEYSNGQRKNVDGNSLDSVMRSIFPGFSGGSLKGFVDASVGSKKFKKSGDVEAIVEHTVSKASKQSGNISLPEEEDQSG